MGLWMAGMQPGPLPSTASSTAGSLGKGLIPLAESHRPRYGRWPAGGHPPDAPGAPCPRCQACFRPTVPVFPTFPIHPRYSRHP